MTLPSWFRGPSTFRARVFWSVIPIIVLLVVIHGIMMVWEQRRLVTEEFMKRGQAMARNLARNSELAVFAEDAKLLESSIRGVTGDPDVAYAFIYGEEGALLAKGGRDINLLSQRRWELPDEGKDILFNSRQISSPGLVEKRGSLIEFFVPILSQEGTTPDTLLLGLLGEGKPHPRQFSHRRVGAVRLGLSLQSVEDQTVLLLELWASVAFAFILLSTFVVYGLSRRITQPVRRLIHQAERISDGFLDETIPVESRDEIGQLATRFNEMARALKRNTDEKERVLAELQDLTRTLEERIHQRTGELRDRTEALQRSLEEVQALGQVSQAISSTLDLDMVLSTIVAFAVQLSRADAGAIYDFDDATKEFRLRATHQMSDEFTEAIRTARTRLGETVVGQAAANRDAVQLADVLDAPATYPLREILVQAGFRALLAVPLLREDRIIGALVVRRRMPGKFQEEIVSLLRNFATQSALAIQNARLFREIEEKGRQLEMASKHKSQFLANMSHELRTPLNAILGYTELVLDKIYGEVPDKLWGVMERVQQSGRHLLSLINDVLDVSKIEAGQLKLSLNEYSLKDVVQTVATAVESLVAEKKLGLRVAVPPDLPRGKGDERRIAQVFLNLVGNAIKFTEVGGITVQVAASDSAFLVSVSDTGPGIAPADQQKIFAEFQQADSSSTKKKGGTGLGLSIARRIIELHGGRIWVESSPGKGSTFAFRLPIRVDQQVEVI